MVPMIGADTDGAVRMFTAKLVCESFATTAAAAVDAEMPGDSKR